MADLQVRFESRSFWTLYRIDYKGDRLCVDHFGSHYGSVVSFPGIGFIGSGHTENEDEEVIVLQFWVNGEEVARPQPEIQCQSVRLHKRSRIKALLLETDILVKDNQILEEVVLTADEETPVNRIYHFMHPWTPTITEYAAELLDGSLETGSFTGDRRFRLDAPTRWSAVYDEPTGKGAVTVMIEAPDEDQWKTAYWDVPDVYRKHYLVTFLNGTVPPIHAFHYKVVTLPFEDEGDTWVQKASSLAESFSRKRAEGKLRTRVSLAPQGD